MIFISLLVLSCSLIGAPAVVPQESDIPGLTETPTKPESDVPIVPSPSPTPIDSVCVTPKDGVELPDAPFEQYPDRILEFLNRGGALPELDTLLYDAGIANQPLAVAAEDMTGDGKTDVVVSIFNPDSLSTPPGGVLLIFICQQDRYTLARWDSSVDWEGAPGIRYFQDLNSDGRADLITGSPRCGAHTCFEDVNILSWNGNMIENRLMGITDDLPYPTIELQESVEEEIFDVVITGGGFGSVGAGPQRSLSRQWSYRSETGDWQVSSESPGASNYRVHVLHDADGAARQGDYPEALLLYQRVISDMTLVDWADPTQERANLAAYARFRMAVVYLHMGQTDFARVILAELDSNYPPGSGQHGYVEMARLFYDEYQKSDVKTACKAARGYAAKHEGQILKGLGPESFGYGNPVYEPQAICDW